MALYKEMFKTIESVITSMYKKDKVSKTKYSSKILTMSTKTMTSCPQIA